MEWLLFYLLFSGMYTAGVGFKSSGTKFEFVAVLILSLLTGWILMPVHIGMWMDLNDQSDKS